MAPNKPLEPSDDRLERLTAEFTAAIGREVSNSFEMQCGDVVFDSKSPIEKLMAAALFYSITSKEWFGFEPNENFYLYNFPARDFSKCTLPKGPGIMIMPQSPVGKYKADFLVRVAHWRGGYVWGAIECDGHDHHNLTKDQAKHDRERDRAFQDKGLFILRYTGSEIWKSALKCATDALALLDRRADSETALRWEVK